MINQKKEESIPVLMLPPKIVKDEQRSPKKSKGEIVLGVLVILAALIHQEDFVFRFSPLTICMTGASIVASGICGLWLSSQK